MGDEQDLPASPLAYECTKKVYELLGLDPDNIGLDPNNIYGFTVYDLLSKIIEENDNSSDDGFVYGQIAGILKQVKKPQEIMLDDAVKETGKVDIIAIVGNPPYQKNSENNIRSLPVYPLVMGCAFNIAVITVLITPARFLFNEGMTSKKWNSKILNNEHFRVIEYIQDSSNVFNDVKISGGIAITENNNQQTFEKIGYYIPSETMRNIVSKIHAEKSLSSIVSSRGMYRFTDQFFDNFPETRKNLSIGTGNMIASNVIDKFSGAFSDDSQKDSIGILSLSKRKRVWKYVKSDCVRHNDFIDTYNVVIPHAFETSLTGGPIVKPVICEPGYGHSDTFLSIGKFTAMNEVLACQKYIKTQFARALLGIVKIEHNCTRNTWRFVPLQDFTSCSDIDWSKSIAEIDQQLYKKYGLSNDEINYIEEHVQLME